MRSKCLLGVIALIVPLFTVKAADESADEAAPAKEAVPVVATPALAAAPVSDPPGMWASFEYLNWWIRSGPLRVPLIAAGNPLDTIPGAIGEPGTRILTGRGIDFGTRNGGRATVGAWLDSNRSTAVELSGFFLENKTGDGLTVSTPLLELPACTFAVRLDLTAGALTISDPLRASRGYALDHEFGRSFLGLRGTSSKSDTE